MTRRLRTPVGLVAVAGAVYALLQVTLVGLDRPPSWDEVVYLAQVTPDTADVWFGAHRARGMSFLMAPVGLLGAPLLLVRIWAVTLSVAGLVLAFRPWTRVAGWAGGAAALVAAVGWVPVYFGPELYPNLLTGLAAVGTAGHFVAWCRDGRRGDLRAVVVGLAVVAVLRPTESVWLAAALVPVLLVLAPRRAPAGVGALFAGGVLGWLPWIVEAVARFGGPIERLTQGAQSSVAGQSRNNLIQYLNLVEGPVRAIVPDPVLTVRSLALLLGLALLVGLGIAQRLDRDRRRAAVVGAWIAAALLAPYLVLDTSVSLRYVTPALLAAAVPIGAGLVTVVGAVRRARSPVAGVTLAAVLVAVVGWQAVLAQDNAAEGAQGDRRWEQLGAALDEVAGDDDCAFLSPSAWPQIQWRSGCLGSLLEVEADTLQCSDSPRDMAALAERGHRVFVLDRNPPEDPPLSDWPLVATPEVDVGAWYITARPEGLGLEDPPRPADPDEEPERCPTSRAPDAQDARLQLRWDRP